MTLRKFLQDMLAQLENRKMMIPRYVERPQKFAGRKKDFTLEMLPQIEADIEETKAAIKGIDQWKNRLPANPYTNPLAANFFEDGAAEQAKADAEKIRQLEERVMELEGKLKEGGK